MENLTLYWNKQINKGCYHQKERSSCSKIKQLETEFLEEKFKSKVFNTMIDISGQQHGTCIRKKYLPNQSNKPD